MSRIGTYLGPLSLLHIKTTKDFETKCITTTASDFCYLVNHLSFIFHVSFANVFYIVYYLYDIIATSQ